MPWFPGSLGTDPSDHVRPFTDVHTAASRSSAGPSYPTASTPSGVANTRFMVWLLLPPNADESIRCQLRATGGAVEGEPCDEGEVLGPEVWVDGAVVGEPDVVVVPDFPFPRNTTAPAITATRSATTPSTRPSRGPLRPGGGCRTCGSAIVPARPPPGGGPGSARGGAGVGGAAAGADGAGVSHDGGAEGNDGAGGMGVVTVGAADGGDATVGEVGGAMVGAGAEGALVRVAAVDRPRASRSSGRRIRTVGGCWFMWENISSMGESPPNGGLAVRHS